MISFAHDASSAADVGRQREDALRLGVSETPVTLNGPPTANSRRCGSVVMPKPDADLRVGQRVIDRRQQVVGHRVEALHERRRQAMRAGLDVNRAAS